MPTALTSIIFRTLTKAGFTTKGSDLTWLEEDTNKEIIIDNLAALIANAIGNIAPYDPGNPYDVEAFAQYVSYNGNIYLFIGTGPATGITPGTVPAATIWQLTTSGALAHAQNTDIALAAGTPFQINALQIKGIYDSLALSMSYSNALNSITVGNPGYGTLRPGYLYYITDRRIYLQAISQTEFKRSGILVAKNCDYQNASGVFIGPWRAGMSGVALNKICCWNGVHYKNTTGVNGGSDPIVDTTNWLALATTDTSYQTEADLIIYDVTSDHILFRADKRGNEVGLDSENNYNDFNPVSLFQWGNDAVERNKVTAGFLSCINQRGNIKGVCIAGGAKVTANNSDTGQINFVTVNADCIVEISRGSGFSITDSQITRSGSFIIDAGESFSELNINDYSSNLSYTLDITGFTSLDFSGLTVDQQNRIRAAGKLLLTSSNSSETIAGITNANQAIKSRIILTPSVILTALTITHTASNRQNAGASIVMNGAKEEFIEYLLTANGLIEYTRGQY